MSASKPDQQQKIYRGGGVTRAERYLKSLCDRTFLSLWSYPGVYRDQGQKVGAGDGKEVCDLLVVFEDHVIIFSDKDCSFPDSGDLDCDWSRWFRRAVQKSADQVWGAERWIKTYPDRLFLDRACTQRFPLPLPDPTMAKFHRIVVAHDSSDRCCKELGGSGSLVIIPRVIGDQHLAKAAEGGTPFAIGRIDPAKGFIHVLDDTTLDVLLRTLDTVTDFVAYLTKKERFITSGKLIAAAGEEELLAHYLTNVNEVDEHDFVIPKNIDKVGFEEGGWDSFVRNPQRQAQISANEISYAWDRLIEAFNGHAIAGTQYFATHPGIAHHHQLMRFLAREPRTRRRMLAGSLLELMADSSKGLRRVRVVQSLQAGDPYYIFLVLEQPVGVDYDEYREARRTLLEAYCLVVKLKFPAAVDIVGVATGPLTTDMTTSEDVMYLDAREWTSEQQVNAEHYRNDLGLLSEVAVSKGTVQDYPTLTRTGEIKPPTRIQVTMKGRNRNERCPCGSGKKFKHCCGRRRMTSNRS